MGRTSRKIGWAAVRAVRAAWLLTLGTSLSAAPGPEQAPFLIEPGQSIGRTHLGMNRQTVHALLHGPTLSRQFQGLTYDLWAGRTPADAYDTAKYRHALQRHSYEDAVHLARRYVEVVYRSDKVVQIETDSPQFTTRDGVSAGNRLSRVAGKHTALHGSGYSYGPPDPDTGIGYNLFYEDDVKRGIAFVVETSPHADFGPDEAITAIIVHRSAQPVSARPRWINRLPKEADPL